MPRKRRRTPQRYGWVELLPADSPRLRRLSPNGHAGLAYLRELAENAAERRTLALSGEAPKRLTIAEIAREDHVSRTQIYDLMRRARIELFGKDLSDSAMYARVRQEREHGLPAAGPCAEPGCTRRLPIKATARRRYCNFHLAPHARESRAGASAKPAAEAEPGRPGAGRSRERAASRPRAQPRAHFVRGLLRTGCDRALRASRTTDKNCRHARSSAGGRAARGGG